LLSNHLFLLGRSFTKVGVYIVSTLVGDLLPNVLLDEEAAGVGLLVDVEEF
jgi:hypothetical protein